MKKTLFVCILAGSLFTLVARGASLLFDSYLSSRPMAEMTAAIHHWWWVEVPSLPGAFIIQLTMSNPGRYVDMWARYGWLIMIYNCIFWITVSASVRALYGGIRGVFARRKRI
jgi:hypothetical protein